MRQAASLAHSCESHKLVDLMAVRCRVGPRNAPSIEVASLPQYFQGMAFWGYLHITSRIFDSFDFYMEGQEARDESVWKRSRRQRVDRRKTRDFGGPLARGRPFGRGVGAGREVGRALWQFLALAAARHRRSMAESVVHAAGWAAQASVRQHTDCAASRR